MNSTFFHCILRHKESENYQSLDRPEYSLNTPRWTLSNDQSTDHESLGIHGKNNINFVTISTFFNVFYA